MYETINSSVNYGGLELKNRIIFAPTTFGLSDEEDFKKSAASLRAAAPWSSSAMCLWAKV